MIDLSLQKHFAIQHVHNVTGDFITDFSGTTFGEVPINPSLEGITFFRHQGAHESDIQIASYKTIDTALSNVGGLDGVIVFGKNTSFKNGRLIAKSMKEYKPDIKIILINDNPYGLFTQHSEEEYNSVFSTPLDQDTKTAITEKRLGITVSNNKTIFSSPFKEDDAFIRRLNINFHLTDHFDAVIISAGSNKKEIFTAITETAPPSSSPKHRAPPSWNREAREQYFREIPSLEKIEDMVGESTIDEWNTIFAPPQALRP